MIWLNNILCRIMNFMEYKFSEKLNTITLNIQIKSREIFKYLNVEFLHLIDLFN